ncbi:MAG: ADP compounds hydrolase NudE [Gammaproteobacteria bacterium]
MHSKPTILSVETTAQSRLFEIQTVHLRFSNGVERHYERLQSRSPEAVMVVAVDDGDLILIKEYGLGIEDYTLGFPKGLIDEGETAEIAGNRELQEEAGYAAEKVSYLTVLSMNPGYSSMRTHIVLAKGLYPSILPGDEPEPLEVVRWPINDLEGLVANPAFNESRAVAALFWVQRL